MEKIETGEATPSMILHVSQDNADPKLEPSTIQFEFDTSSAEPSKTPYRLCVL